MQLTWTPIAKMSAAQVVETSVTVFQQQQSYSGLYVHPDDHT